MPCQVPRYTVHSHITVNTDERRSTRDATRHDSTRNTYASRRGTLPYTTVLRVYIAAERGPHERFVFLRPRAWLHPSGSAHRIVRPNLHVHVASSVLYSLALGFRHADALPCVYLDAVEAAFLHVYIVVVLLLLCIH